MWIFHVIFSLQRRWILLKTVQETLRVLDEDKLIDSYLNSDIEYNRNNLLKYY